ncbi:hypothetical protein PAXINDRAFT_79788 [Paxillus involutus ATCC 200175]|uniref:DUF6589 domain-containing protein n=1 Tax=Paxillus involutus ATCC 200175 TaxID=664439 RepID=A0A0C9TEY1_PAXIN|nr:hypothetical protein PAXINDRAFT_79788 [Paxillus involutus ATCC 200175]
MTVAEFIILLLTCPQYENHQVLGNLLERSEEIFKVFLQHLAVRDKLFEILKDTYLQEIQYLASKDSGWHFGASKMSTKQLEDFSLGEVARKMEACAPNWWSLLGTLLNDEEDDSEDYWDKVDEIDLEGVINALTGKQDHSTLSQSKERRLLFPMVHGVRANDLKCSDELWRRSSLNPQVDGHLLPQKQLVNIHPECASNSESNLSCRDQFNSWMVLHDLCTYGPEYFHQFKSTIKDPDPIEQIPLVKTPIFAARAMDVNNSTMSGNIRAVVELLAQGGISDPVVVSDESSDTDSPDISQYVILIHGDLGTGERLQAAQLRRSIESTPWNRFQHVIFIPGLFHLKMACADALWHCFIHPSAARNNETSLMWDVAQLRPKETGIYTSKPGFRRMHQLIGHAGVCRRLDCWRVHIQSKRPGCNSLEEFAASDPTLVDLKVMADEIAHTYVATYWLQRMRRKKEKERNLQFENALLLN